MSKVDSDDLVVIGKVTRTHGVRGEMRVLPYSADVDSFNHYERLYFQTTNGARELLTIDSLRPHKNFALLKLKEVHGVESAKRLVRAEVLVERIWMPPLEPDEYYWADLVGLKVIDREGRNLGQVKRLLSTGADDLLVVEKDQQEYYLPFREEIICSVDLDQGRISASPPPGLLEL